MDTSQVYLFYIQILRLDVEIAPQALYTLLTTRIKYVLQSL